LSTADLALMCTVDELHSKHPPLVPACCATCSRRGFEVGRKHEATLMRRMNVEALYRKPNTSKRHPEHQVYPYLVPGLAIDQANQVWAMDITYIPMTRAFVYVAALIGWHSRRVLAGCRSRWWPTSAFACANAARALRKPDLQPPEVQGCR
jgi:putative transposase